MTLNGTGLSVARLQAAYTTARRALLAEREDSGHWVGELATSALSTATAVSALSLVIRAQTEDPGRGSEKKELVAAGGLPSTRLLARLVQEGVRWLAEHQNSDGGWGDTQFSYSNISTTLLAVAALHLAGVAGEHTERLARAETYIAAAGRWSGLKKRYGRDKTFAVPILTNCALAGLVDWREVSALPFEMACLPQSMYRMLRLPVVSYAIPALVAIGQAKFFHRAPWNPVTRWMRSRLVDRSLRVLEKMQPASGGYLEAVPLTSFVVMSLAATGRVSHAVTESGVRFLVGSVRPDGSWPIDTNLATWNTTLSLNALAAGDGDLAEQKCLDWLLSCQTKHVHPFTGAEPGGWGWTDLSGAVPDADDTPSALLALATWSRSRKCSGRDRRRIRDAAAGGIRWLLGLQNSNGGWPTFCRGWGKLPFDRSGADLTAHVIRALHAWQDLVDTSRAVQRGLRYLERQQRSDGSWVPLWFGNQDHPTEENPVYGTARVLLCYRDLGLLGTIPARRGVQWLLSNQNADGGWGAGRFANRQPGRVAPSSVEETALAMEALLSVHAVEHQSAVDTNGAKGTPTNEPAAAQPLRKFHSSAPTDSVPSEELANGLRWLVEKVERNEFRQPSPIGFYFAKLWYHERLYPIIFSTSVLGLAVRLWSTTAEPSATSSHRLSVPADSPLKQPCP